MQSVAGMTHVKTSPYYPQSNGKIDCWHKTLKGECIRVMVPLSLDDARRIVDDFVRHYNAVRLHSAIGYVAPLDKLEGRDKAIQAERDRKLAEARERRRRQRLDRRERRPASHDAQPAANDAPADQQHASVATPRIDFARIREQVAMTDVLQLLGFRPRETRGAQQRGPCPLHGSTTGTSRCFSANVEQKVFRCFKCNRHGNALDLWAAAQRLAPYDAARDLAQRLNIPLDSCQQPGAPQPITEKRNPSPTEQNLSNATFTI